MRFISVIFCALFVAIQAVKPIPDYVERCKRSDPQIADCIINSIHQLKPYLLRGIPELDVVSLDPYRLDVLPIFKGKNDDAPVGLKATLYDIVLTGGQTFKVTKMKIDSNLTTYRFGISLSKINVKGMFEVSVGHIKDNGKFTVDLIEPNVQGVLSGNLIDYNGHKQFNFTDLITNIKMKNYSIDLEDNFQGMPIIKTLIDEVLSNNKDDLLEVALPFFEKKITKILLKQANIIASNLDFDDIYPE